MSKSEEALLEALGEENRERMNGDLRELLLMLAGPAPPTS